MKDRLQPSETFPSIADFERIDTIKKLHPASAEILEESLTDDRALARVQRAYLSGFADEYEDVLAQLQSTNPEDISELHNGHSEFLKNQRFLHHDQTKIVLAKQINWNADREMMEPMWLHDLIHDVSENPPRRSRWPLLRDIEAGIEALVKDEPK